MGVYVWTHIRIDKLTPEMIEKIIDNAKKDAENSTIGSYQRISFDDALNHWLSWHEKDYDYFTNELGVPAEQLTVQYLKKELQRYMANYRMRMRAYQQVLDGKMSIEELLHKTHQIRGLISEVGSVVKRNGHYYIAIDDYEVFRCRIYSKKEFFTVDSLIEYCRSIKCGSFLDYSLAEKTMGYQKWDGVIESHVREFYEKIGDGNFCVQII